MKRLLLVIILAFVLVGCQPVQESEPVIDDHEQMIQDLIERIGELEQEVGNLKNDITDGTYPIGD